MISQWLPTEETTVSGNGGSTILCLDSIKSFAAFAQPWKIGNHKTKNRRRSPPFPGLHCHTLTPRIYSSIYTILKPGKADFKQSSLRSRKTLKSLIYGISSLSPLFLQRLSPEDFFLLQMRFSSIPAMAEMALTPIVGKIVLTTNRWWNFAQKFEPLSKSF